MINENLSSNISPLELRKIRFLYSKENKKLEVDYDADDIKTINWAKSFIDMLNIMGKHSHCVSKKVACFIVKNQRIISTGINGTPQNLNNCDQLFHSTEYDKDEHHNFSLKYEIHAEINALLNAAKNGIKVNNSSIYVNYSPCRDCAKSILAAGIKSIYFKDFYLNDLDGIIFLILSNLIEVYQIIDNTISVEDYEIVIDNIINRTNEILLNTNPFILT